MAQEKHVPLARKLGVRPGSTLTLLDAPPSLTLELPPGVTVRRRAEHPADVVVAFAPRVDTILRHIERWSQSIFPDGGLWIAWPKKSSGVATDVTDHAVRDAALPLGLVDNKVCSIDATWTALRVVWRLPMRSERPGASAE